MSEALTDFEKSLLDADFTEVETAEDPFEKLLLADTEEKTKVDPIFAMLDQAGESGRVLEPDDLELFDKYQVDPGSAMTFSEHRKSYDEKGPMAWADELAGGFAHLGKTVRDAGIALPNIVGQLQAGQASAHEQKTMLDMMGVNIDETGKPSWLDMAKALTPVGAVKTGANMLGEDVVGVTGIYATEMAKEAGRDWATIARGAAQLPFRMIFKGAQGLGVFKEEWGEQWDRKDDEVRYHNYLKNLKRRDTLQTTLTNLNEAYGIDESEFMDTGGNITTPWAEGQSFSEAAVVGGSLIADPSNLVGGAAFAKVGSTIARGAGRAATKLGVSSGRMADINRKALAVFSAPTRTATTGVGRAVRATSKPFEWMDAVSRTRKGRIGIAAAASVASLGTSPNPLQLLGIAAGAWYGTGMVRPFSQAGRGLQAAGEIIEATGKAVTAPTRTSALRSRNLTANRTGRAILGFAASSKLPVRALVNAAGRATYLTDTAARGAIVGGAMGYVATGDIVDAFGEAGGGAFVAGAGNVINQAIDPIAVVASAKLTHEPGLGRIWSLGDSPTKQAWQRQFVQDFEETRNSQEIENLNHLPWADKYRIAQASTIMQGMATDGRADITDTFLDRNGFSELLADRPELAPTDLNPSWTKEQRAAYWRNNPALPRDVVYDDGRPSVVLRTDAEGASGIGIHAYTHALTDLQGYDPLYDPDERELNRFERQMHNKYGPDYRLEELDQVERSERSRIYGDPIAGIKSQLFNDWFGKQGNLLSEAPNLYNEYWGKLGVPLLRRAEINAGQKGTLQWNEMNARERLYAKKRLFDEILAEKSRNIMEDMPGELLPRLEQIAANTPRQGFLLDQYTNGVLTKMKRGLESIGATSDIFEGMGTNGDEGRLVGQLWAGKARMTERLGLAPTAISRDYTFLDINPNNVQEMRSTGLIDEAYFEETGQIREATPATARTWTQTIHDELKTAIANTETWGDRNAVRRQLKGALAGRYLHPEQLNALLDSRLPTRIKQGLIALNNHLLPNQHPEGLTRAPLAPLSILYYSDSGKGRKQAKRHEIQPYEIGTSSKGNLIVRSVHMGMLERSVLPDKEGKSRLDPSFTTVDEYLELASQYLRGNLAVLKPEQASILGEELKKFYRTFRLDRIGTMTTTADISPRDRVEADMEGADPRFAPEAPAAAQPRAIIEDPETTVLFRATNSPEDANAIPKGTHWSPDRETAEAYQDNPGFGGSEIVSAIVPTAKTLDVRGKDARDLNRLAEQVDGDREAWRDAGYDSVFSVIENVPSVREKLKETSDWLIFLDDYPENATTWVKL